MMKKTARRPKKQDEVKYAAQESKTAAEVQKQQPAGQAQSQEADEDARRIAESREVLKHPLSAGQQLFEAPDGYIIVGEASQPHMVDRRAGKSWKWINPRR